MIKVVITKIPLGYYFYYQWLILGFYELKQERTLNFSIKLQSPFAYILARNYKIFLGIRKYLGLFKGKSLMKDYLLRGYIEKDGKIQHFCYDIADTPYYFDEKAIKEDLIYFKAQCPINIVEDGFELTPEVKILYHPEVIINKYKIFPSMLAPGGWAYNIFSYKSLRQGYQSLFLKNIKKEKKLMCYFGGNRGPKPEFSYLPDLYLEESQILAFYKNKINHPNEKRALAAQIIAEQGNDYDSRIIKVFNEKSEVVKRNDHLFIPLNEYKEHISKFRYNLNISGYRKSIPNRFIYSFCVGTAIVTDKLSVKWYLPFDEEVLELEEMGYLPNNLINWEKFTTKIKKLEEVNHEKIISAFHKKWSPKAFAEYVVETCLKKV